MRRNLVFLFCGLAACSRSSSSSDLGASPNPQNSAAVLDSGNSSSATTDAAVAVREDCAEPKKLTQLATVNEEARFTGESLDGAAHAYDPETGAAHALGPKPVVKPTSTDGRYAQVAGGWGLIWKDQDIDATVEDVATKKKVMKFTPCAAGGSFVYSLSTTGRFLDCSNNRNGDTFYALANGGKPITELRGPGVSLAPSDKYAVVVPAIFWGNSEPTGTTITYVDLDTHKSKEVAKAAHLDLPTGEPNQKVNPYSAAFCGAGALFVASTDTEVAVYRGKDGARLAAAPALKGGLVSFSQSGKYISQSRNQKTTVFRLDL